MNRQMLQKNFIFWGVIGIIAIGAMAAILHYLSRHPSTDDAYVQANTVNIAAQVNGPVASIYVQDHQAVKKDQLLFTIDPSPFQIAVDKANAAIAAQQATYLLAQQNASRILRLVKLGQVSKASGDQAQAELESARATLAIRQAELAQAKLNLAYTYVKAPRDGIVTQFLLRPGNNITADTTLFMLVEQNHFWVNANFKETQLARIKTGQMAIIQLDMFPNKKFHGIVDAVSSASGSLFSLLPPENASGNWVKVTQRFPVKINIEELDPAFPLRAGATASVTIDASTPV